MPKSDEQKELEEQRKDAVRRAEHYEGLAGKANDGDSRVERWQDKAARYRRIAEEKQAELAEMASD